MSAKLALGVLVSGGGTNLQAVLDACSVETMGARALPAEVRVVLSNKPGVFALERAARAGVATEVLSHKEFATRERFDARVVELLRARGVELVVLAGFMRVVTPVLLDAFPSRVVNVHPALLPAFPGVHAQEQALRARVRITGCTVHLVDAGVDTGPVLAQTAVPVHEGDTVETLSARILVEEHRLLPAVLRAFAEGRVEVRADEAVEGRQRVTIRGVDEARFAVASPSVLDEPR